MENSLPNIKKYRNEIIAEIAFIVISGGAYACNQEGIGGFFTAASILTIIGIAIDIIEKRNDYKRYSLYSDNAISVCKRKLERKYGKDYFAKSKVDF